METHLTTKKSRGFDNNSTYSTRSHTRCFAKQYLQKQDHGTEKNVSLYQL